MNPDQLRAWKSKLEQLKVLRSQLHSEFNRENFHQKLTDSEVQAKRDRLNQIALKMNKIVNS